jgi:hypothetical protein
MLRVRIAAMVQEHPVRVERRLSAILAADVAGYSRLMHHDEEATHAKLTALLADSVRPAVSEHGGRIVKNTGDGFLAEFPSAVEAVRTAVQFQTRIKELTTADEEDRRIAFRVGVNIGDVIVEPNDIFGDGVNIAARLESIAEPGGICISSLPTIMSEARSGPYSPIWVIRTSRTSPFRSEPMWWFGMDPTRRYRLSARGRARFHLLIFPSLCCLSLTSAGTRSKSTSLMA